MEFFDTHCHLDFPEFDNDRDEVIAQCDCLGVKHILIPGVSVDTWPRVIQTAALKDTYYSALGLHPMFIDQHKEQDLDQFETYIKDVPPVAIGEIGLDFYIDTLDRKKQHQFFEAQLDVAKKYGLPVVLHVRKAHDEVLKLLRIKKLTGGFVHAFSGSEQQAFQYLNLNFKLGFGGAVSYERANKLKSILKKISSRDFVLETDAPDMSPFMHNGKRNSPQYLPELFQFMVTLRRGDANELAMQLMRNSTQVLNLP